MSLVARLLAVTLLIQILTLLAPPPIPKAEAGIEPSGWTLTMNQAYFDRSSYWVNEGSGGSVIYPPTAHVAIIGTGVNSDALATGIHIVSGFGLSRDVQDPSGRSTADASVIAQLYPAPNLTFTSFAVQGNDCGGGVAGKVLQALQAIAATTTVFDAVLMDFEPRCVEDPIQWAWDQVGGDGGQGLLDEVNREIIHNPVAAERTSTPTYGPAITFNTFTSSTAYGPPGYAGQGKTRAGHPYHDISPELAALGDARTSYHTSKLTRVLGQIQDLGLPVIAPAGDNRTVSEVNGEPHLQTILGLSQLDSVITVGAATTSTAIGTGPSLAPTSGVGLTRMGTIKPDLIAPGFQSIWVPDSSYLRTQSCTSSGVHWNDYACGDSSMSYLNTNTPTATYVPRAPTAVRALTPYPATLTRPKGFGSTYIASAFVVAQVLTLRTLWPGSWPEEDATAVVRSVLQAKASRLNGVAPYEQGAGLLDQPATGEDVSSYPLPLSPMNLEVTATSAGCGAADLDDCASDGDSSFYGGGAVPVTVTASAPFLLGGDVTGSVRSADVSATYDSTATVHSQVACSGSGADTCRVTMSVVAPSAYAGIYCGWYKVQAANETAQFPFCSPRAFPVNFHLYYADSRPVPFDVVSLDLYFPAYLGIAPMEVMPVTPDPKFNRPPGFEEEGKPFGMFLSPPNVTVYSGNSNSNGDVTFDSVLPGLYNVRIYSDYGVTQTVGVTTTQLDSNGEPRPTTTALNYLPTEIGTPVNYPDRWPLVVASSVPCPDQVSTNSRVTDTVDANLPVWLACRPDRESWTKDLGKKQVKEYYDENDGVCLQPLPPATLPKTPYHLRPIWQSTIGGDRPPDAPPPPARLAFVCHDTPTSTVTGTVNSRMGVPLTSLRIKNLKFGVPDPASGTMNYQMKDPSWPSGVTTTQSDVDYGVCYYTTHRVLALDDFPANCEEAPTDSFEWESCTFCDHPSVTDSVKMSYDALGKILPVPNQKLPFGFLHHQISLARPNYFAHLDLSFGYTSTNTILAVVARAGEDVRVAIATFSGYTSGGGTPVFGAGFSGDPLNNLRSQMTSCTSSCVGATPTQGRASFSFDFPKARNSDHADIWFLAIPTSIMAPAVLSLDAVGYAVRTFEKARLCKPYGCWVDDDFVTMTVDGDTDPPSHPDSTNTLRLNFASNLDRKDAYEGEPFCRSDVFGCDNMVMAMGVPKGAPTWETNTDVCNTYSRLQDVVERRETTKAHNVLTWQRGIDTARYMQKAIPIPATGGSATTLTVDSSGFPALLTSQAYEWWNVTNTGMAVVTHSALAEAARNDPGMGRMAARLTTSDCATTTTATAYPSYSSCPAEPEGSKLPQIPYRTSPPAFCHPYTIEPRSGSTNHKLNLWIQAAVVGHPPVYCEFVVLRDGEAPYWQTFMQRPMQIPGC